MALTEIYDEDAATVQAWALLDDAGRQKQADRLRSLAASATRVADMLDPSPSEGIADFDHLPLNVLVKVGGDWPLLLRKVTKTDAAGQERKLILLLDGQPSSYPVSDGEVFAFGSSF